MSYALPYALNIIFLGLFALVYHQTNEKVRHIITLTCFVYAIFFFGLRGYIWHDWQNYYILYHEFTMDDFQVNPFLGGKEHFYEPGYVLFNIAIKYIYNDYVFFQLVQCIICQVLLFRFMTRRKLNVPLFLLIFLSFYGYEILINLMRNSIAILIILNALEYIEERKPLQYFAMCLLALTFHISSIAFIPLYWLLNIKINRWVYLGLFLSGVLFFLLRLKIISPILALATGNDSRIEIMMDIYGKLDEAKTLTLGFMERLATGLLVFGYYGKLLEKDARNRVYINALLLYLIIVFFFYEMETVSTRLGILVIFGYWMIYYQFPQIFYFRNNKLLFCSLVMAYCLLKTIGYNSNGCYEYQNHLLGCRSYEESIMRMHKLEEEK